MSPRAAMGPQTAFSEASSSAPARASRTPRSGRPFSGRNRSASATSGHNIETATASRWASSDGEFGFAERVQRLPDRNCTDRVIRLRRVVVNDYRRLDLNFT